MPSTNPRTDTPFSRNCPDLLAHISQNGNRRIQTCKAYKWRQFRHTSVSRANLKPRPGGARAHRNSGGRPGHLITPHRITSVRSICRSGIGYPSSLPAKDLPNIGTRNGARRRHSLLWAPRSFSHALTAILFIGWEKVTERNLGWASG